MAAMDDAELQRLYAWVDEIPLSRPKRNIARDFADGVLVAEVCHIQFDARPHCGADRQSFHIGAFSTTWPCLLYGIDQRADVSGQLLFRETGFTDTGLHNAFLFDTKLNRAAFGCAHRFSDISRHRADFRVRH